MLVQARRMILVAAATALALPASPAGAQDTLWPDAPWRGYVTGTYPQGFLPGSLAAGDLDGDGDTDLLVGHTFFAAPGVSVLLNRGDGSYDAPAFYALPQNQSVAEVALADMDGDGDLDAYATVRGAFDDDTKLRVWRNGGDGTLGTSAAFTTGPGPTGLVVADFTGDGKPDVATANWYWSALSVSFLRHNGQAGAGASYLPRTDIPMGMRVEHLAAADVNGDGDLDLAVGGFQESNNMPFVSVLANDGTGAFAAPVVYQAAPGGYQWPRARVALRDLDNDGDPDLVNGGAYEDGPVLSGAIVIRMNDGLGVFGPHQAHVFPEGFNDPWTLSTADLTGDGFLDVVASVPSGRATDGYVVLPSTGAGSFGPPAYYEAEQWTYASVVFDADGDGDADVATVGGFSTAVTVHENPGTGSFRVLPRHPAGMLTDAVESADIDNDGDLDIVANSQVSILSNDALVVVLKNAGDGTFVNFTSYTYAPPRNFGEMKLRDLNGDGFVDLLLAPDDDYPPYNFGTALNNGDGTFATIVVHAVGSCGNGSIDAADLDGDGDRDVVLTEELGCPSVPQPRIFVFRNDGNQAFTLAATIVSSQGFARGMEIADLNGDGRPDLVTALSTAMGVFPNNGGLSFGAPILSSSTAYKFRLADFDGDGKMDVGMILPEDPDSFQDRAGTASGLGGGMFGPVRIQRGSTTAEALRISDDLDVADFDGDGRTDLLTFNYASNDLSVFLSAPNGAPLPQQRYGIGNTPIRGTVADFNGDGRPDVAASIGLPPWGLENAVVVLASTGPLVNFGLSCSPAALTVVQGTTGTSACTVQSLNAFASAVDLECAGLPAGLDCAFAPPTVTPPANGNAASTLTISVAGATPPGVYTFQARGLSGGLLHVVNMTVTVAAPADFGMGCTPAALTAAPGGTASSTCTVQSLNAFAAAVGFTCTGLPAGATCSFVPAAVTPPANGTATSGLTVTVAPGTVPGTYGFLAQGASGTLVRTFAMSLSVVAQSVEAVGLAVDGNGVFEPNESAVLAPSWRNSGAAAMALTGALSGFAGPAGPVYSILDGAASYGTVAAGATASCLDCYTLRATAATRPATHWDTTVVEVVTPTATAKTWTVHVGGTFADVAPASPFYRFVETILHDGVTGGCSATAYCPSAATTREQIAVFVLVAKEPAGYAPPPCGAVPMFADVPASSPFCRWVEELARRGVVGGCGSGNYCPAASVTRGQMAVFVLRTLDPVLDPPACGAPLFADVPASSPFCRWIEELARRGVVTGCGGGNYCPSAGVTREQMAVFLAATFGLALYGP